MATDGDQPDRRAGFDIANTAEMAFEVIAGFTERVLSSTGAPSEITIRMRRSSGRATAADGPTSRPHRRYFPSKSFTQHQARDLRAAPGGVGGFVDNMPEVIETPRVRRFARGDPLFACAAAFQARVVKPRIPLSPRSVSKCALKYQRKSRRWKSAAPHGTRIIDQQRDHGVTEIGIVL